MSFEPRVSIITLGVEDMATSRAFYQALGWTPHAKQSNESVTFFQGNGIILGLYGHDALAEDAGVDPSEPEFRGVSLAYNCRSEQEVDALFVHAISVGADLIKQPEAVFWGGYSGYFADPDGHLWELAYNPFFEMNDEGHLVLGDDDDE